MFVFNAAVVGAGTMGGEIAHTIADAGIPVVLKDVDQKFVETGTEKARSLWQGRVDAGKLEAAELERRLALITGATDYEAFGDVDFVVEAVPERIEIKQAVFAELDAVTPGHAILASNTSSLSITEMGEATSRPDLVVGFHFFFPASVMRLIEVIEGEDTSPETAQTASQLRPADTEDADPLCGGPGLRGQPDPQLGRLRAVALPGGERDRRQGARPDRGRFQGPPDGAVLPDRPARAGHSRSTSPSTCATPTATASSSTVGCRSWWPPASSAPRRERASMSMAADLDTEALIDRFTLKALVESCLVLEEGVASMREIDLGMMAGAGIIPPPFARADQVGLDEVLAKLERAAAEWGESFEPPTILRRLVAQGRLGVKSGQGFFPYANPDAGCEEAPVKLETRGEVAIAWLDRPPANSISPEVAEALQTVWDAVTAGGAVRALVFASANPMLFCAGADIKAFTKMDPAAGKALLDRMHGLLRALERSSVVTIAAVNAGALGGGCELAMACDFRIAAESATFGQPEISLGIIPGFGGTQRLPRLVGAAKALELNLIGDPISADEAYELGLATRVVPDHELLDTALALARRLAEQAPLAVEQIKQVSAAGDLDAGIEAEKRGFTTVFGSDDAREGISAFLQKRAPRFSGT